MTAAASDVPSTTAMDVNLDTTAFLYQNRTTGQPSASSLTARQLCRILCPVTTATTAAAASSTSMITPQTLIIGFDPLSSTYDPSGWRAASSVPVLREACASWYHEGSGGVKGPVSTRVLASFLRDKDDDNEDKIFDDTRVYAAGNEGDGSRAAGGSEWARIRDLPHLKLAMEALTEVKSMPESWPAEKGGGDDIQQQIATMTYDEGSEGAKEDDEARQQKVKDELEAFLTSTDDLAPHAGGSNVDTGGESDEEEYESDGGTRYVKDPRTGNWIHEALAPKRDKPKKDGTGTNGQSAASTSKSEANIDATTAAAAAATKKRKRNKPKFSAKNARNWIYVTGLPSDTNEKEVASYFSKVGVIDLDIETQKPKVKLYRLKGENGGSGSTLKGDASICYARPESVDLALQILDENLFRDGATLSVQRAKFEQHGAVHVKKGKRVVSEAKRKVARLAALQAVGWDEGENGRIAGGLKGLRIVVLMNVFDPRELRDDENDQKLKALEKEVRAECDELGSVEKITVFSNHPAGVMIIKFVQPNAASDAVNKFNGMVWSNGRKVEALFWDGTTDYTCRDEEKEEKETGKRLDEFGDWLEEQDLPEEFKLRVEE